MVPSVLRLVPKFRDDAARRGRGLGERDGTAAVDRGDGRSRRDVGPGDHLADKEAGGVAEAGDESLRAEVVPVSTVLPAELPVLWKAPFKGFRYSVPEPFLVTLSTPAPFCSRPEKVWVPVVTFSRPDVQGGRGARAAAAVGDRARAGQRADGHGIARAGRR